MQHRSGALPSDALGDGPLAARVRLRDVTFKKRHTVYLALFIMALVGITIFIVTKDGGLAGPDGSDGEQKLQSLLAELRQAMFSCRRPRP